MQLSGEKQSDDEDSESASYTNPRRGEENCERHHADREQKAQNAHPPMLTVVRLCPPRPFGQSRLIFCFNFGAHSKVQRRGSWTTHKSDATPLAAQILLLHSNTRRVISRR